MTLHQPTSLAEALAHVAGGARVLAGGTDLYPGLGDGPVPPVLVDLTRIPALRGITAEGEGWRIGAATTWAEIVQADLPAQFAGLQAAAREVGAVQVQTCGTIGGNLCNASPAADGVVPLLTLDATVEIAGPLGLRHLPLAGFVTGPRRTALRPGEIVTALHVPRRAAGGAFVKLGARRYLVISVASVAALVQPAGGHLAELWVAVGACAPVPTRLPGVEAALRGAHPAEVAPRLAGLDLPELAPIDDIRAPAAYRRAAVRPLIARAIARAWESADAA